MAESLKTVGRTGLRILVELGAKVRKNFFLTLAVTVLFLVAMYQLSAIAGPYSVERNLATSNTPIKLKLELAKRQYRLGEPVSFSTSLENKSTKGEYFYVGADLGSGSMIVPDHQILLSIKNAKGQEMDRGLSSAASVILSETIQEKLNKYYVLLRPNYHYGIKGTLHASLPAGQYLVSASYEEFAAQKWQSEQQNSSARVWLTPLQSNIVKIVVR